MVYDAISRYRKGPITADLFKVLDISGPVAEQKDNNQSFSLPTLKEASSELVEKAMKQTGGNQSAAAMILGISQQALSKRLQKLKSEKKEA